MCIICTYIYIYKKCIDEPHLFYSGIVVGFFFSVDKTF